MTDDLNNVNVYVRVRPPLERESLQAECLVSMEPNGNGQLTLQCPREPTPESTRDNQKSYNFDECIWSFDLKDSNYSDNFTLYQSTGITLLEHFFRGYNVCLLAYGQTGSGKTYTMMGEKADPGLVPIMVRGILQHIESLVQEKINCSLLMSLVEIYNEKVKDLLANSKQCRIREHPVTGPYVDNLQEANISSYEEFESLLDLGNSRRAVASTSINQTSSRSHAIVTLTVRQTKYLELSSSSAASIIGDADEEMVCSMKFVDLAGSERMNKAMTFGSSERVKEGTQINKSLAALGRCINILSQKKKNSVVPYRDSVLTYLLRESLAGNSKTAMIFCVSPFDYDETSLTLNYASQVKHIKTEAKANSSKLTSPAINWDKLKDLRKSVIETLQDEVNQLTTQLDDLRLQQTSSETSSLLKYLERENLKHDFEIKYLSSLLHTERTQRGELLLQNAFLHQELTARSFKRIQDLQKNLLNSIDEAIRVANSHAYLCHSISQNLASTEI